MRDLFKANCGKPGGLLGAHGGRIFDVEVESAFDTYVTFLKIDDQTRLHVPYGSIRVVLESENGIRWKRIPFQRRRYNLLIQIDSYERQIVA
jgi:hypothetical protein